MVENSMRAICLLAVLVMPCTFAAAVNAAPAFYPGLSIVNSSSDVVAVKNKIKWKGDGCKYEYKESGKGFQEKYKCK
jgi:hypothetical protein